MSSMARKSTYIYLWLFALLRFGWGQDTVDISQTKSNIAVSSRIPRASPGVAQPICGKTKANQTSFVINENTTMIGALPWNASIYIETITANGTEKLFTCDATIIQDNLVLTAAHCIYDKITNSPVDHRKLFVIMGNVIRDYDSTLHDPVTVGKSTVKNVYRDCLYNGSPGKPRLALLELQSPFNFSEIILPACLDIEGISNGFEKTKSTVSSNIPKTSTNPIRSCQCDLFDAVQYEVYTTTDQFRTHYTNGSAVCESVIGSGLVSEKGILWLVMGFVSVDIESHLEYGKYLSDRYPYSIRVGL